MPRSELQRLNDVVEAADLIAAFVRDLDEESFVSSALHRSAVAYQFLVIGEAVKSISAETWRQNPQVPWRTMAGFRDVLAHGYFGLTWPDVWVAATEEINGARAQIQTIIDGYRPENQG